MADENNTLASYGITDAYTKTEVDALIPVFPTVVSAFINDVGYLTQHQDISGKQDKLNNAQMRAATSGITTDKIELYDTYSAIIDRKADKADSLAGYGIKDTYRKEEVEEMFQILKNVIDSADID